ncbi:hypothetical protein GIY23_19650 [Allosaccharopolyspora coralli]|uniref:Uncharacterized protein n=1 Tax=Allosaccharopolyspora coralli TaxID=2665642 RepID=A0A5Q3QA38_9PSEU|nr:hypothetical protein [Allosaccharopolyspora coralli]QGK71428.1 hypothetical protein GIY23_19650 [Allosaccharopolyspora coralli]
MAREAARVSPGQAAFWEALGLTLLMCLVFALRDGVGMTWLLASALLVLFLIGWAVLYFTNRFSRRHTPPSG